MHALNRPLKPVYSEIEAANALGVSLSELYSVLDRHIFNDGTPRPPRLELTGSDLLIVSYYLESPSLRQAPEDNVLAMPNRSKQ